MASKHLSSLGLSAILLLATLGATEPAVVAGPDSFEAHTEPSKRSKVNFAAPGIVSEMLVQEGDTVKKDQLLIRLDDRADRHLLESLKLEGESRLKVEAAEADLAQKKNELRRKEDGNKGAEGTYTVTEVEESKINVLIREIQVKVEEMTRKQKELEAARQSVKVEQMTIRAPFDGIVEKIELQLGETPDQQRAAVSVVKNDVLWVNFDMPTSLTVKLKLGDEMDVRYKDTQEIVKGKLTFLSPVADYATETRRVRLEVQNPNGLPSGLAVTVFAPGAKATASAAIGR